MDGDVRSVLEMRSSANLSLRGFAMRVVSELARPSEGGHESFSADLAREIVSFARTGDQGRLSVLYTHLKQRRVTAEGVMDVYLPHAVQVIGQAWHDEEIDVLHASMACARMQNLLREMGRAWASDRTGRVDDGRVLLTLPVGEQHSLGAMLLANQLRRRGVSVKVMLLPRLAELRALLKRSQFHAVFISASNATSLEPCAKMVRELRCCADYAIPIIIGGGLVSSAFAGNDPLRIAEITGADTVTSDIERALHACGLQQVSAAAE